MAIQPTPRRLWTLFESVHALPYFSPEMARALEKIGLQDFHSGYLAARAAPLGPVGPATVTALFYNFSPRSVEAGIPSVWRLTSPEAALAARVDGAVAALQALGDVAHDRKRIAEAADVAWAAVRAADTGGRALGAANAALDRPREPLAALWLAATALRELRGDCHVVALVMVGLSGLESLLMRVGSDLPNAPYQTSRAWTDQEWSDAREQLAGRGLVDATGSVTDAGRSLLREAEAITDRLAAQPWAAVGTAATVRFAERIGPLARAAVDAWPPEVSIGLENG
ncbi:SCO6745 family protein [Streptomyces sp. cg40]|uniref:SCO6745 family protein n=1 Tax=Streptomyces sp. cg40 TaxID=3419764 RepID=UPI003D031D1B